MIRRLLLLLTLGVIILALFNVVVWLQVFNPTGAEPGPALPTATLPRAPAPATATPAPGELTTIDQISQAIASGRSGQRFRVSFTEQQISDEINTYLQDNPDVAFRDISVQLQPGVAIINGKAQVLTFDVGFKATTTIILVNGRPRLKVQQIEVAGAVVPGVVKDLIAQMIEQQADLPLLADLPVTIQQVEIQQGQVVVSGTVGAA